MVWANTRYVGCGYVNGCQGTLWNGQFVCNYFPAGNFNSDKTPPYTSAESGEISSQCMMDRTANSANYDSVSTTASEYDNGKAYNALCGDGACKKMCDGQSWSRDNCDHCEEGEALDCKDGTNGLNGGRAVCGDSSAMMLSVLKIFLFVLIVSFCVV